MFFVYVCLSYSLNCLIWPGVGHGCLYTCVTCHSNAFLRMNFTVLVCPEGPSVMQSPPTTTRTWTSYCSSSGPLTIHNDNNNITNSHSIVFPHSGYSTHFYVSVSGCGQVILCYAFSSFFFCQWALKTCFFNILKRKTRLRNHDLTIFHGKGVAKHVILS